jgi:hypothetical protein
MAEILSRWLAQKDMNSARLPPEKDDGSPSPSKRLKLTADNGVAVAARFEQQQQRRAARVSLTPTKRAPQARRAKLALLPALPIDLLFEVRIFTVGLRMGAKLTNREPLDLWTFGTT